MVTCVAVFPRLQVAKGHPQREIKVATLHFSSAARGVAGAFILQIKGICEAVLVNNTGSLITNLSIMDTIPSATGESDWGVVGRAAS